MYRIISIIIQINHVELSPNYAGTLMGLTGAVANTAGFISPYIVGVVVEENVSIFCIRTRISTLKLHISQSSQKSLIFWIYFQQTLEAWSIVFVTASVICVVLNIVFLIFGTSERQWWDTHWMKEKGSAVQNRHKSCSNLIFYPKL